MSASGVEIKEIGTVIEIRSGIVKLTGLPSCVLGQLIESSIQADRLVTFGD